MTASSREAPRGTRHEYVPWALVVVVAAGRKPAPGASMRERISSRAPEIGTPPGVVSLPVSRGPTAAPYAR